LPARRDLHPVPTRRSSDLTFALLPETGALVLHRRCHADDLQAGGLAEVLAGMASVARHWREQLLAEAASSEPSEPHSFLEERARSEEHTSELQSRENLVCR